MITNINDFIKMINEAKVYDTDDLYEVFEENDMKLGSNFSFEFVENTNYRDVHRWYEVGKEIYEARICDTTYFVGIYCVSKVFSEMMCLSDTDCPIKAVQCRKVPSYRFEDVKE